MAEPFVISDSERPIYKGKIPILNLDSSSEEEFHQENQSFTSISGLGDPTRIQQYMQQFDSVPPGQVKTARKSVSKYSKKPHKNGYKKGYKKGYRKKIKSMTLKG